MSAPLRAWKGLNSASGFVRREINNRLKMRRTPDFHFVPDNSTEYSADIARILNGLDIQHEDDEALDEEETDENEN